MLGLAAVMVMGWLAVGLVYYWEVKMLCDEYED